MSDKNLENDKFFNEKIREDLDVLINKWIK
jgi:hypothetical protein